MKTEDGTRSNLERSLLLYVFKMGNNAGCGAAEQPLLVRGYIAHKHHQVSWMDDPDRSGTVT